MILIEIEVVDYKNNNALKVDLYLCYKVWPDFFMEQTRQTLHLGLVLLLILHKENEEMDGAALGTHYN